MASPASPKPLSARKAAKFAFSRPFEPLAGDFSVGRGRDDAGELFAVDVLAAERFDRDRAGVFSCGARTEKSSR